MPPKGKAAKKRKFDSGQGTSQNTANKGLKKKGRPDPWIPNASCYEVFSDHDALLNQTNISERNNNNKYYVIQVIKHKGCECFFLWTRWGRVGESGQTGITAFGSSASAVKDFQHTFKEKTGKNWQEEFTYDSKKYTLIDMAVEDGSGEDAEHSATTSQNTAECTLDASTQELIKLIFNNDVFQDARKRLENEMPLAKLSSQQIEKGFEILKRLEEKIDSAAEMEMEKMEALKELSSEFYSVIPHVSRRTEVPEAITSNAFVQTKYDMLEAWKDIYTALSMLTKQPESMAAEDEAPNPLDNQYRSLKCSLSLLDKESNTYQILKQYFDATKPSNSLAELHDIWEVDREEEDERFKAHDRITERKLLWFGSKSDEAVIAALREGFRIRQHTSSRGGKRLHFASESRKYVHEKTRFLFLNEVAMGRQMVITNKDGIPQNQPEGCDSVLVRGSQESDPDPDPDSDEKISLDGKEIVVPLGKPKETGNNGHEHSSYIIYKESQIRIRYLVQIGTS